MGETLALISDLEKRMINRGPDDTIKYIKGIRGQLFNYLSDSREIFPGVKVTKSGIPTGLGDLGKSLESMAIPHRPKEEIPKALLLLLTTILFATRTLKTGKNPNISSITLKLESLQLPDDFEKYIKDFWSVLGIRKLK